MIRAIAPLLVLAACAINPTSTPKPDHPLGWLTGCWELEDGSIREIWSTPEGGYLFAHSVNYKQGKPAFFEQLRIDPSSPPVLHAYPMGRGPTSFLTAAQTDRSIAFINRENDFPQRITYARAGDRLSATIALSDGSNQTKFAYRACWTG